MNEYIFDNRIYYRTNEFKPDRLTLVLAHGVSGSSSAWLPYEKIFKDKYNLLTYDIRGHGMSKKYPNYEDYEINNFVNDLHDLVSYLDVHKFVLISNSFAGLIHLGYLKLWRDTVLANVFTSPEVYLNKGRLAKISRPILTALTGILDTLPFNKTPRGHVDYSKHPNSTDWDISRNLADMRNTGLHVHLYTLRKSFYDNGDYDLGKINVPTLIIHGEKDSMVPLSNSFEMSKKIKNSDFIAIPGIDHNTVHNAVKEMSLAIDSFIEKNKAKMHSS